MNAFENLKSHAGVGLLALATIGCSEDAATRRERLGEALGDRYHSFEIARGDTVELRPFKDTTVTVAVTLDDKGGCPRIVIDDQGSDANYSLMSFAVDLNPPYIPHLGLSPNKEGLVDLEPYYYPNPNLLLLRCSGELREAVALQLDRGECFGINPEGPAWYFPVSYIDQDLRYPEKISSDYTSLPPTFSARILPREEDK